MDESRPKLWPDERRAWERQDGETAKAYEAARTYFDLGPGRTLRKTCENLGRTWVKPGGGRTGSQFQMESWSTKYQWVSRAKTFDEYLETERQRTFEEAAARAAQVWLDREIALRQRRYEQGTKAMDKVDKMLEFPLATVTTQGQVQADGRVTNTTIVRPARWSMDTAGRLALIGQKMALEACRNTGATDAAGDLIQEEFLFTEDI